MSLPEREFHTRRDEESGVIRVYTPLEAGRLQRLYALHSEVRLWERFLIRREGQPYSLTVRLPDGTTRQKLIDKKGLERLWDARDELLKDCGALGKGEDAKELMEQIDLKHKEMLRHGPKIPDAFKKGIE